MSPFLRDTIRAARASALVASSFTLDACGGAQIPPDARTMVLSLDHLDCGDCGDKLPTAARLGVSLPVGSTQPDPYRLGAEGKSHEHTQLGTGTFVPIVGLGLSYQIEPVQLSASALGLFSLYQNRKVVPAWQLELGLRARAVRFTTALAFDYPGLLQFGLSTHFNRQNKEKEGAR